MKKTSSDPPDIDSNRSGAQPVADGFLDRSTTQPRDLPSLNQPTLAPSVASRNKNVDAARSHNATNNGTYSPDAAAFNEKARMPYPSSLKAVSAQQLATGSSPQDEGQGVVVDTKEAQETAIFNNEAATLQTGNERKRKRRTVYKESRRSLRLIATHSWMNVLLVFVPLGIALAQVDGIHAGVIFAINCIAVIPLAGLLSFATESVALKMGDALGALLNVTFGNAVELIIFVIALVKNQIRIVQASLLGSILANLLLILGMGFFFGGLRYREQVYNSTVTQMSACLLSLSVISLVLPTAFHASFSDVHRADTESLKISRGTSVILLLVYAIYLLFQLRSHAYMYESTPQNIVDAESAPGPAAAWLDSSSSDASSSDSSDSDASSRSRDTVRRKMKKVLRGGRRRKSSVSSFGTLTISPHEEAVSEASSSRPPIPRTLSTETNEEAIEDEERSHRHRRPSLRQLRKKHKKKRRRHENGSDAQPTISERPEIAPETIGEGEPRRVDFAVQDEHISASEVGTGAASRRPFPALRVMSVKNLAPAVFAQNPSPGALPPALAGPVPRVRYGIRRTNSLPDRLHQHQFRTPGAMLPAQIPMAALTRAGRSHNETEEDEDEEHLTQWASIILLLVTTGLVAACAEFLIGSIEEVVATSSIGEIFIGLIVLPIVGNAAEHVTAVTVAMKNKMDLAIGVAVGSSIQIAIFVTPLVVILGWILDKDMTLYFTLFETVCLFVSAFMVNFLVLDGRSNYLEGALLCAVYLIIGVVAFFYPDGEAASSWGS